MRMRLRPRLALTLAGVLLLTSAAVASTSRATGDGAGGVISRSEIIARASAWFAQRAQIPYDPGGTFRDADGRAYRTDCSGFVSMAWHLRTQVNTRSLPSIAHAIAKDELQTGDVLDAEHAAGRFSTGHAVLFVRWTSPAHTAYLGYEFGSTPIELHVIPYPYFPSDPRTYVPYTYDRIAAESTGRDTPAWYRTGSGQLRAFAGRGAVATAPVLSGVPTAGSSVDLLLGDWNGDGTDTVGWYDRAAGTFHLRTANTRGGSTITVAGPRRGAADIEAIKGDWTGSGTDRVGWYDPADGTVHLLSSNATGAPQTVFVAAPSGDPSVQVIAGDWNGDGTDTVGWYRPGDATFHLLTANVTGAPMIDVTGAPRDDATIEVIAGDWNGDGTDGIGWYRPADGTLELLADAHTARWNRVQQPAATGGGVHVLVGRLALDS